MKYLFFVLTACLTMNANARVCDTCVLPANNLSIPVTAAPNWFPANTLYIPDGGFSAHELSKAGFDHALDAFEAKWAPVVKAHGYKLKVNRLWSDGTVNSDTDVEGGYWVINSYGGLARYPGMTADGYMLVACHELGHHMGGAPLYRGEDWPSNEGEADYWATLKCLKVMFGHDNARILAASKVLAKVLADLEGSSVPQVNTPDRTVVSQTNDEHPAAQCRLDTYVAGMNCNASGNMDLHDPKVGSCYSYPNGKAAAGSRPLCWFKP